MSRSTSTFSLSDSAKSSAVVQRSNSLDHPPVRARVPVCIRTPCSPGPDAAQCPSPSTAPKLTQSPRPKSILHAPLLTQPARSPTSKQPTPSTRPTTTSNTAVRNSAQPHFKASQPKSSQHVSRYLPSAGFQLKSLAPQPHNANGRTFSESCRDPQVPMDPHKAALTGHRRETLL